MSFIETPRFPDDISYGSSGGPGYDTTIVVTSAGHEKRNANWSLARHNYNIAFGVRNKTQLATLISYFHAMAGRAHGFRYKDHSDYSSADVMTDPITDTDQTIGTGDNSEVDFQLIKTYTEGALSRVRNITKPVAGTTVVALDGTPQPAGWSIDTTTGIITFDSAPGTDVIVTAGFEFDVPCRFGTDTLQNTLDNYLTASTQVPVTEIRG